MMKTAGKILFGCALLCNLGFIAEAQAAEQVNWSEPTLAPLVQFFNQEHIAQQSWPNLIYVKQIDLPEPFDFLLTQPLMTIGVAQHYQRIPKVRAPLYVVNNPDQQTYSRGIVMIVDNDKQRDDALAADQKGETTVTELGFSKMNFAALPAKVKDGILHTQMPLGSLLADSQIATKNQNVRYFKLACNKALEPFLNCTKHPVLYGRTNTLVRDDNGQWLVDVVEILTGASIPAAAKSS